MTAQAGATSAAADGLDEVVEAVEDVAEAAGDHPVVHAAVRVGHGVNGLVHLLMAWICLQLAMLHETGAADQSGALESLASHPVGLVALWLGVAGFVGLALWQVCETIVPGLRGDGWGVRLKDGAKSVVYGALAWSCLVAALSRRSTGTATVHGLSARLLGGYGGRVIIGLIGLGIVGVGIYHVVKGLRRRFLRDLEEDPGDLAVFAGMVGYPTRGLAIMVVGLLFVQAATANSAARTNGLDGAFHFLLAQPLGRLVVAAMGVGLGAFAVYLFFRARHADV